MYQDFCRICSGSLEDKLNLGNLYPSGFMKSGTQWPEKSPLVLAECQDCSLVQLRHMVPLDSMYRQYWYRSGLNASMVADLKDVVQGVEYVFSLLSEDIVLDIGCNDGTLFDFYDNKEHLVKIGYDPSQNVTDDIYNHADHFVNDYFSADLILDKFGEHSVKVITAIAMFYDLPDPNWFLQEIKKILHPSGIFVVQFTDLVSMLRLNAFDNICHEHLEYYSLKVLKDLMQRNDFEVFEVEYNTVNGGSLRAYIQHSEADYPIEQSVEKALLNETRYFNMFSDPLEAFKTRIDSSKELTMNYLLDSHHAKHIIHTMSASTKGNTLLQYFELSNSLIPYAAEVNEDKYGLVTVGSNIYILPEKDSVARRPDIYLVLPWHFESTFTGLLRSNLYTLPKTKMLFPLPVPKYYYRTNGEIYKWIFLGNLPQR